MSWVLHTYGSLASCPVVDPSVLAAPVTSESPSHPHCIPFSYEDRYHAAELISHPNHPPTLSGVKRGGPSSLISQSGVSPNQRATPFVHHHLSLIHSLVSPILALPTVPYHRYGAYTARGGTRLLRYNEQNVSAPAVRGVLLVAVLA